MKKITISEASKILNMDRDKLQKLIKYENLQLDKINNKFHVSEYQLSYLIEKYKVDYIYIESKMNEPEPLYSRKEFIEKGYIIHKC